MSLSFQIVRRAAQPANAQTERPIGDVVLSWVDDDGVYQEAQLGRDPIAPIAAGTILNVYVQAKEIDALVLPMFATSSPVAVRVTHDESDETRVEVGDVDDSGWRFGVAIRGGVRE